MLHLTRCCLCVTMLAVTTAFAQTSTIQDQMGSVNAFTAEDDSRIDTNEKATRTPDDTHVVHDQSMTQRERVLTRAIKSLEKRLEEPAPKRRRSESRVKRNSMISIVVSIQPLIRMGLDETDIVGALKMITHLKEDAAISTNFHKETGLLFIKTGFETISLVDDVLEQLDVTAEASWEETRRGRARSTQH